MARPFRLAKASVRVSVPHAASSSEGITEISETIVGEGSVGEGTGEEGEVAIAAIVG